MNLTPENVEKWTIAITAFAGVVGAVGSAIASSFPKDWRFTQVMARLFADLRGIRPPPPPKSKVVLLPHIPPPPPPPRL